MTSREAFEAHIKSMIESEAGEAQALARRPDDDYITEWVRHQWWGWQTAIQHASDVAVKACEAERDEYMAQARGGDNSGHSDCRAEGADACADAIKEALK